MPPKPGILSNISFIVYIWDFKLRSNIDFGNLTNYTIFCCPANPFPLSSFNLSVGSANIDLNTYYLIMIEKNWKEKHFSSIKYHNKSSIFTNLITLKQIKLYYAYLLKQI